MEDFIDRLFIEYPIPRSVSIWWTNGIDVQPVEDITVLIRAVVKELASDILRIEHVEATGIKTILPEDTIIVSSAKLSNEFVFQGNRLVKATFDAANKVCFLRYYPAIITYKRKFRVSDLENLEGDELIYVKCYALWKMAEKELSVLKSVNMTVDHGNVDLSVLTEFSNKMKDRYEKLKEEILIYSASN